MKNLFPVLLLSITFFALSAPSVYSQTDIAVTEASPAARKSVEYTLPYPGLLPDSPFYGLKMMRDRIVGFLIADPVRKAQFNLLQADKRLQAGVYLINKDHGQATVALSTIAKGQNYFEEAFVSVDAARKQGNLTPDTTMKLSLAAQKHLEVLRTLASIIPQNEQAYYRQLLEKAQQIMDKASAEAKKK